MKNCLKIFFLSFVFSLFLLPTKVDAFSGSGSGTENSPYVITTCSQLQEMNLDLDGYYELGNDIDCTASSGWSWAHGTGFRPIGGSADAGITLPAGASIDATVTEPILGRDVFTFQGTLDGKGYEISNIFENFDTFYGGLFGATNGAVIKNFTLTNPLITSWYIDGGLVGYAHDTAIINVDVVLDWDGGNERAAYDYMGGMVGVMDGGSLIQDSDVSGYFGVDSSIDSASGGMVAYIEGDASIVDSSSSVIGDFSDVWSFGCAVGSFVGDTDGAVTIDGFTGTCALDSLGTAGAFGGVIGHAGAASGHLATLNITDSSFDGSIITNGTDAWGVGGVVGYVAARTTGSIDHCDSNVDFDMAGVVSQTGGLIGANRSDDDFNVLNSDASGTIDIDSGATNSMYLIGGLVGAANYDMLVNDSSSDVDITIINVDYAEFVGGISGRLAGGSEVNRSTSTGDIAIDTTYDESPAYAIGGIVGAFNMGAASVNDSYFMGDMTFTGYNTSSTGGIVGDLDAGSITDCFAETIMTSVEGDWGDYAVGGICGSCDGTISGSVAHAIINTGIDGYAIGGLAGYADSITNSYAEIQINAMNGVAGIGGLAGISNTSGDSILNAYATGEINLADTAGTAGGLVGRMVDGTTVTNAYSNVVINLGASSADYGGLIGFVDPAHTVTVTNSYWDETTSGISVSDGGTAYSVAQMKVQGNYTSWDFNNIWAMDSGINDGYPYFGYYETDITPSQSSSSAYSKSYSIDLSFGGTWPLSEVKYQWSEGYAPNPSAWVIITDYDDIPSPDITGSRLLQVYYSNILGFDTTMYTGQFLLDNTPPTVDVDEATSTMIIDVTENESGISVVQYFWSESTSTPSGGWQDTSQGEEVDKPTEEGTWYLHVRSLDNAGNLVLGISDAVVVEGNPIYIYNPVVPTNDPNDDDDDDDKDDDDKDDDDNIVEQTPTEVVNTVKIPKEIETPSRSMGEILSAFIEEPVVRTSILATGVASSVVVLSPAFWLNWGIGIWERILSLFGIFVRKKNKRSGVVYNSRTKEPIKLAVVRFFDKDNSLITTEVTDSMGAFSFENDGKYKIEVSARRFSFPSSLIKGSDSVYANVYDGGYIQNEEVSIPLDEKDDGFIRASLVFLANRLGIFINVICWLLFILGFALVIYDLYSNVDDTQTLILFGIYIFLLITSFISLRKTEGNVVSQYGDVLSGYKLILRDKVVDSVSYQRVTDEKGQYKFVVPEGNYTLQVLNTSGDVVFTKDIVDARAKNDLITVVEDIVI